MIKNFFVSLPNLIIVGKNADKEALCFNKNFNNHRHIQWDYFLR